MGNVEAKELISMTHGHELYGGNVGERGGAGWSGVRGGDWDNCNSIINKYILKKRKVWQITIQPSNSSAKYLLKRNENIHAPQDLYVNAYSGLIYNIKNRTNPNVHQLANGKTNCDSSRQ